MGKVCPSTGAADEAVAYKARIKIPSGRRPWNPTPSTSLRAGSCAKSAQEWATPAVNSSARPLHSPRSGRMALEHGLCRTMGAGSRSPGSTGYSEAFDVLSFVGDVQFAGGCIGAVHATLLD